MDKWNENLIDLYCAVELKAAKESAPNYGVVWFQARTEVDKVNRLVTLDHAEVTKVKFPVAPDKEPELTALLERKLPGATKTISLDRLEVELEAGNELVKGVDVKNDPPKVIIANRPSLQVLIFPNRFNNVGRAERYAWSCSSTASCRACCSSRPALRFTT